MKNISLNIDKVAGFVSKETIAAYEPQVKACMETLENGTGKGNDFLGWLHLPSSITAEHLADLKATAQVLRDNCDEDYFTLLLRRFMMRLAERTANKFSCDALITGESIGQVASQTMKALLVTDSVVNMPVFRPVIGMDKEDIVKISRKIDTFETSILPYEDCCTVFTPAHPRTQPEIYKVENEEARVDVVALEEEAFATLETVIIK